MVTKATEARKHKNHNIIQITSNQKQNTMGKSYRTSELSEDDEEYKQGDEEEDEEEEDEEEENEDEDEDEYGDGDEEDEYDERNEDENEEKDVEDEEDEEEVEEKEQPDEEEEEEDEGQAGDEDTEMGHIIDKIEGLEESEIDICRSDNASFFYVTTKTNEIRERCNLDNFELLKEEMIAFATDKKTIEAFTKFRGICQFIMHIHKRYNVKLTEESAYSDSVLDIIRNVLCKYTNRVSNIRI
jgi:hypothetical protein